MIRVLLQGVPNSSGFADVCIVGAGAAAIVLAVELARQGKCVVVLEGGDRDVQEDSRGLFEVVHSEQLRSVPN